MNTVVLSHMYPSQVAPMYGSFVHNQVRFIREHAQVSVVSPVPWWPFPGAGRWSANRHLPRHEEMDGVQVHRPRYAGVPRRHLPGWTWRAFSRSVRPFMMPPPALIHAHATYPDGLAAVQLGRRFGAKVVLTVHGSDVRVYPELGPDWRRRVEAAVCGADGIIAVSGDLARRSVALGAAEGQLEQIPNGVDTELFSGPGTRKPGQDGWRLLYVGRFDTAKGLADLLQAVAILRRQRQDIHLDLVGGDRYSGPAAPFVELAHQLGLDDCVAFHGAVPQQQIPEHLRRADVFVLASHSEGLPLSLLEAMAMGLPVVSTRCGGPTEVVTADNGQLADVADPPGLAEAIGAVIEDFSRYDRRAIREATVEAYDYRRIATRIHAFYERTLDGGRDTA